jgi:hypothetical protein
VPEQRRQPGTRPEQGARRTVRYTAFFDADQIKNGNLSFTIANPLTSPATVSAAAAGSPSANWTGVNPVLTLTDISLVIEQPVGTVIFNCAASDPNGLSGTVARSCA